MKKLKLTAIITSVLLAFSLATTGCDLITGGNKPGNSGESSGEDNGSGTGGSEINISVGNFEPGLSSIEQAANMAVGWNLGNTLDAPTETGWGMPKTTEAMIKAVHAAGFKTIRIPVSWSSHVSGDDYTIDEKWMARVKEVVDWAIDDGMCVIINIHHDNQTASAIKSKAGFAISTDEAIQTKSKAYIASIWNQVGKTFKDYGDNLVFEVLNEPRCVGENTEWWTNSAETIAVVTDYEQTAVNTIRATGGKNKTRYIMVPGYAASGSDSSMLKLYKMPKDTSVNDKLILSTHAYSPYQFAMSDMTDTTFDAADEKSLDSIFAYLKSAYIDKGIGVVMGEASASDKNNTDERLKWTKYYFGKAKECGIPVVLWDNMVIYPVGNDAGERHGYFNRNQCTWYFPTIMEVMMKTVYGDDFESSSTPESTPEPEDNSTEKKLLSDSVDLNSWSGKIIIGASEVAKIGAGSKLEITTSPSADGLDYYQIKLCDGNWKQISPKGTIVSATIKNDLIELNQNTGIISYTFTSAEANTIKESGFTIMGCGISIDKMILIF